MTYVLVFKDGGAYRVAGFFFHEDPRKYVNVFLCNGRSICIYDGDCSWRRAEGDRKVIVETYDRMTRQRFRRSYFNRWNV